MVHTGEDKASLSFGLEPVRAQKQPFSSCMCKRDITWDLNKSEFGKTFGACNEMYIIEMGWVGAPYS